MESIRKRIAHEEFDYQTLIDCLKEYSRPRDKISELLRKGIFIRVKKGLYIFGDDYRRRPFSREILANLIYGPSYVSLEYALHYYGLILERTDAVTSVTPGRSRKFYTPVGLFAYRMIPLDAFRTGMTRVTLEGERSFLISTPEKALADKIRDDRGTGIGTQQQLHDYLSNDLRVDTLALRELNPDHLAEIAHRYRSRRIKLLSDFVRRLVRRTGEVDHA